MKAMNFANADECYTQLANGGTLVSKFANLLFGYYTDETKTELPKSNEELAAEIKEAEAKKYAIAENQLIIRALSSKARTT